MTLPELFELSFAGRRNEIALDWDRSYTFGEIDARAARIAQVFLRRGLKPGDRICVYLANTIEYIDLFLAATRLGVIFVPVNILYRDREIRHIVSDAEPAALVTSSAMAGHVPPEICQVWRSEDLLNEAAQAPEAREVLVTDADAPAALVYTSGTTGTSKGAVLSHNVFASMPSTS